MAVPFNPKAGFTVDLGADTASDSVALTGLPAEGLYQLRLVNDGPSSARLNFGGSDVVAAADDMLLPAGAIEVVTRDAATHTHVAAITAANTATLSFTPGDGI